MKVLFRRNVQSQCFILAVALTGQGSVGAIWAWHVSTCMRGGAGQPPWRGSCRVVQQAEMAMCVAVSSAHGYDAEHLVGLWYDGYDHAPTCAPISSIVGCRARPAPPLTMPHQGSARVAACCGLAGHGTQGTASLPADLAFYQGSSLPCIRRCWTVPPRFATHLRQVGRPAEVHDQGRGR